jgi:hypothetical protein
MKPQLEGRIYRLRFSEKELAQARAFWRPICRYLQRYIDPRGVTLDLGAGYCHFINNIASREKLALDINGENLRLYAAEGVRCIEATGTGLTGIASASVDAVFASNVYEHFLSREDVARSFQESTAFCVRAGGSSFSSPTLPTARSSISISSITG